MSIRELRRQARRALHDHMAERALYLLTPESEPVVCHVRLHTRAVANGGLTDDYAETQEITPRVVFMRDEVDPERNGIIIMEDRGAWRVSNTLPPDDLTETAEVVEITDSQIARFGWAKDEPFMGLGD